MGDGYCSVVGCSSLFPFQTPPPHNRGWLRVSDLIHWGEGWEDLQFPTEAASGTVERDPARLTPPPFP